MQRNRLALGRVAVNKKQIFVGFINLEKRFKKLARKASEAALVSPTSGIYSDFHKKLVGEIAKLEYFLSSVKEFMQTRLTFGF
jgi:hypothetical protein